MSIASYLAAAVRPGRGDGRRVEGAPCGVPSSLNQSDTSSIVMHPPGKSEATMTTTQSPTTRVLVVPGLVDAVERRFVELWRPDEGRRRVARTMDMEV